MKSFMWLLFVLLHGTKLGAYLMLLVFCLSFLMLVVSIPTQFVRLWKRIAKKLSRSRARVSPTAFNPDPLNNDIYLNRLNLGKRQVKADNHEENIQLDLNDNQETMNNSDRPKDIQFNALAYIFRGQSKRDSGDIQGAIDDFDRAIKINPDYALAFFHRGNAKSDLKDITGALADYDRAIELNPSLDRALYNRANLKYQRFQDYQGALADYNRVIQINPNDAVCYYNRGVLKFRELQDFIGALADFDDAIKLNPNNANAYYNRGSLKYNRLQDATGGIADLQQAGQLYQQQGNIALHQRVLDRLQEWQHNSESVESVQSTNVDNLRNSIRSNLESNLLESLS